ncbi:MAG: DUF1987 domain-containing protein [Bacteroidales bacterium]|nr:DUF1987 domain-containing protein [Bacteroidales bacterium]
MKSLIMNGTDDTPAINFDIASGVFEISGRSLPEEVINFYAPIIDWVEQYALNPKDNSLLKLKLVYFNSASQRYLLEVLNSFEKIIHKGKKVMLEWHYHEDDEEMKEAGEEYQDLVKIPFTFHTY